VRIAEVSVRRPVFATVISLLLIIFGLVSLSRLPVREFPDVDRPVVSISTRYVGASADVIESRVTQVIEDSIAGIEGILKIESDSADERSDVRIEFDVTRDVDAAANDVRDRVARVLAALPDEAAAPQIVKADSNAEPVMIIAVNSDSMSSLELTDYVERYLVDRFSTVPGVARVGLIGQRRFAMRIWIDRQALAARGLAVTDIEDVLRRENVQIPAGRLESQTREFTLRTEIGLGSAEEFRDLVLARADDGHLIRLGEVADVRLAAESERSMIRTNGQPGIGLAIEAQSKANTLDVVRGVRAQVVTVGPTLPEGISIGINIDNGIAIEAALREILIAVVFAFLSVLAVIYGFLGSVRATLIPAVTIPVSIIAAFSAMYALGYSVNVLTLLGLVLAIGLVVDDAIVVLENIHRRIEQGEPPLRAAVTGSREIGFAVLATTATLAAVFVPISFLPGDIGRLFREFGFTVAAAVLFSALVSLTLTPMMASRMAAHVSPGSDPASRRDRVASAVDRFFRALARRYEAVLRRVVGRSGLVLMGVLVLAVIAGLVFRNLPSEFSPSGDAGRVIANLTAPEGTSFEAMDDYARVAEAVIAKEMEKGDILRYTLRLPFMLGESGDASNARLIVFLKPWRERERSAREISRVLAAELRKIPGIRVNTLVPGSFGRRGFGRPVEAVIGGPDYESLAKWSDQLAQLAAANPGLESVDTDYKARKPQVRVAIDRNRAGELGVSLQSVGRALETLLGSRIVTTFMDRGREYNVVLQAQRDERATLTDLDSVSVRSNRTGELVRLSNVARLAETSGPMELSRFDRMRAIEISAGLAPGYSMGEAVRWFEETVARELPPAAVLKWDGESADFKRSGGTIWVIFAFAIAIVFLVLAAQFESFVHPIVIMTTVPLALIGAVLGLKIAGLSVNIFSEIAVVILIGIAAKNGVLIVEFANQLRDRGIEFGEAIVQAAAARLRPVLMTSLCTAFGALPFMFATGAGAEQREPIGVVVFYGTLVAVLLTLFVVPSTYSLIARRTRSPGYVGGKLDALLGAEPSQSP
jgi:multidrug efflux pump